MAKHVSGPPLGPELPEEEGARADGNEKGPQALHPSTPEDIFPDMTNEPGPAALRAKDVMTEDPVCCTPDTPLVRVARMMAENSCGAIPVVRSKDDRIPVGILTDRDIVMRTVAAGRNPLELQARDVETPVLATVEPEATLAACAAKMGEHKIRRLVVVDASGRVCGLLAQADLARNLPRGLSGEAVRGISTPPQSG